ncbi:protein LNK4 isoform X2 [Ziziphus jujuba]|uniref:Protein LNK4 isoform X2 n=1 Tax=Ziziphus jujuba TaxID=326968 RepID=A0ABM3ICK3_ZIZJJ|nr:protein LNK4 isoform X2 [Ziziphus jujuba]
MDWYFGSGTDDLVVPKDRGLSDRLPSPDSWSTWGICPPESFPSPNKCIDFDHKFTREDTSFNGIGLCDQVEMEDSTHDKYQSSSSSGCGGLSDESRQRNIFSCNRPDYQLDDLAGLDQMDDIFLNSLLEDLPGAENPNESFYSPESPCDMMECDDLEKEMNLDSQSFTSSVHSAGSSRYLKTHAFSPSVGLEKEDPNASEINATNSNRKDCPQMKALPKKVLVPSGQNSMNGHINGDKSVEESVLQELKTVMTQLTETTRICVRDSLYRLAKSSKQQHSTAHSQDEDLKTEIPSSWTAHAETTRLSPRFCISKSESFKHEHAPHKVWDKENQRIGDQHY